MAFSAAASVGNMAAVFGKSLPNSGELDAIKVWADVLEKTGLTPEMWAKIVKAMDEEILENLETIASIPGPDYREAVVEAGLKGPAKARLNRAVNICRLKFEMPPDDLFGLAPPPPKPTEEEGDKEGESLHFISWFIELGVVGLIYSGCRELDVSSYMC